MTGKQLKNSILQWAIQGKLVPQDPNDEPASVLLERIRAEKARLIKEKKIKKPKNESIIYRGDDNSHYEKIADGTVRCIDDEIPFEIPESWCWARFSDVVRIASNLVNPKYYLEVAHIAPDNIEKGTGTLLTCRSVKNDNVQSFNHYFYKGQIIYSKIRPLLRKAVIAPFDGLCSADMYPLDTWIETEFLLLLLLSDSFNIQVAERIGTRVKMPKINQEELSKILIPIPPSSEQLQIATKFKELHSLLVRYTNLHQNLKQINNTIFPLLKKSILQEAIQGKLVPQCSEEEPASALLQRVRAEKERLIKEKKIKRDKTESVIFRGDDNCYYEQIGKEVRCIQDEIPFDIPTTWEWARVSTALWLNPKNEADETLKAAFIPMEKIDAGFGSSFKYDTVAWKTIRQGYTHFADGDVAFAKITPCFQNRKSAIFTDLPNGIGAGTTELRVLRPYADTFERYYLLYFLESPYFIDEATFKGTANQQRIIVGYLENKLIPIPPIEEQRRIVAKIEQLFEMLK